MKLAVVTAGLSVPSSTRLLADRLAAATVAAAGSPVSVDVVELRDIALDVTKNLLTGFPSPALRTAIETVTGADALIVVTPVFTAGYSGLFKSFFDVLDADSLVGKPVLLGATGGTERHSLVLDYQLRPLFGYLKADPVATGVYAASSAAATAGWEVDGLASAVIAGAFSRRWPDLWPFLRLIPSG